MTCRLLLSLGLVSILVGLAPADDQSVDAKKSSERSQPVKEALEAAKQDLPRAIAILEKALDIAPDDRDALYLLGAMSFVLGDKSDNKSERIALFRKSTEAFVKLQKASKELTSYEKAFLARSRVGESCVLASEGKADQALAVIQRLLDAGFGDLDSLNDAPELASVRERPAFKLAIESALSPGIQKELADFKSFPFDFALRDLEGNLVRRADSEGKVTIVNLWGTWCPPCRAEIPHFVDLQNEFRDQGLVIVGINCNETGTPEHIKKTIQDFAKDMKMSYKCLLNDEKSEHRIPGFRGYPTTLFLDRSGKVRMSLFGYNSKAKLEVVVKLLLAENPTHRAHAEGSK